MTAIICTTIICVTVLFVSFSVTRLIQDLYNPIQQPGITEEDLDKAYKEAASDNVPDFQDVINFINKEFTGVEDSDEG